MPTVQFTWIADSGGAKAYVSNDQLDYYSVQGWKSTPDPLGQEMVWLEHNVHHGKQLFAASVVPVWKDLGWEPTSPPEPVDVLHDQDLTDVAPELVAEDKTTPKKAASGSKKEQ
jgi:hypothetical protein